MNLLGIQNVSPRVCQKSNRATYIEALSAEYSPDFILLESGGEGVRMGRGRGRGRRSRVVLFD